MHAQWDAAATVLAARCFKCLTREQAKAVQTYALAITAGLTADPRALVAASSCFRCVPLPVLTSYQAAFLGAIANGEGITADELIEQSACSKCVPPGMQEQIIAYQFVNSAGLSTDPATLVQLAACLMCLSEFDHAAIQTYLLCVINGDGPCGGSPDQLVPPTISFLAGKIPMAVAPGIGMIFSGDVTGPWLAVGPSLSFEPYFETTTPNWWDIDLTINMDDPTHVNLPTGGFIQVFSSTDGINYSTYIETVPYPNAPITRSYTNVVQEPGTIYYRARWISAGGTQFGAWSYITVGLSMLAFDDFGTYSNGSADGLNEGSAWVSGYGIRDNGEYAADDMENYANDDVVNGLNDGTGWSDAYVTR